VSAAAGTAARISVSSAPRSLGMLSILCLGINAIIGSGIYKAPGRLGYYLGPASWLAFAVVGVLLMAVALCFAEAAGMFESSGGPYVYTRAAFGVPVGFSVGWIAWVVSVTSWGAVANAIPGYLALFVPAAGQGIFPKLIVAVVIGGLGVINYFGVKPGAMCTNFFTVAKIVPLAIFVIAGVVHISGANVGLPSSAAVFGGAGGSLWKALGLAMFVSLFPLQGFETAPVPAGETDNPRRNVPIAVVGSLLGCTAFYALIQLTAYATHPVVATANLATNAAEPWSKTPVADAAGTFLGSGGAALMTLGACISFIGFCSGSALVAPRYLQALARDGLLPPRLGELHARHDSPHLAILLTTAVTLLAGLTLDFDKLVDLSNVAVIFQYVGTCAAIIRLRYSHKDHPRSYRIPGGPWLVPMIGIGICALLAAQASWVEFAFSVGTIAIGGGIAYATRLAAARA
jgi:basic amino acid/polyamine antiporter, APA family